MLLKACGFATAAVLLLYPQSAAGAVSVQYTLVPMGGNVYRYIYSITNDGSLPGGAPVQLFDIGFDPTLYSSLSIVTSQVNSALNAQWTQSIFPAGPGFPALYNALSISASVGIPAGSTATGFAVQFTWLGATGQPGAQPFQIYNPSAPPPIPVLQSGNTFSPAGVPVSSDLSLLLIGLGLALAATYQLRTHRRDALKA